MSESKKTKSEAAQKIFSKTTLKLAYEIVPLLSNEERNALLADFDEDRIPKVKTLDLEGARVLRTALDLAANELAKKLGEEKLKQIRNEIDSALLQIEKLLSEDDD